MNWGAISFDWNQVRAFLATAEEGSLSAAARALHQTQPTLSRQVTQLEQTLGVTLFERGHRRVRLTDAGLELLEHVRAMADAANRVSLAASGQSQGIVIEVIASDEVRDLIRREADIAIRHAQPTQLDLIARRVGSLRGRIFAAPRLLEEVGVPRTFEDLVDHDFIGIEDTEGLLAGLAQQGLQLRPEQFRVHAASGNCMLQLIREGLGFGFLPMDKTGLFDDLVCVLPERFDPEIPVWVVSHRELRTSRRIRVVFDLLSEELAALTQAAE